MFSQSRTPRGRACCHRHHPRPSCGTRSAFSTPRLRRTADSRRSQATGESPSGSALFDNRAALACPLGGLRQGRDFKRGDGPERPSGRDARNTPRIGGSTSSASPSRGSGPGETWTMVRKTRDVWISQGRGRTTHPIGGAAVTTLKKTTRPAWCRSPTTMDSETGPRRSRGR